MDYNISNEVQSTGNLPTWLKDDEDDDDDDDDDDEKAERIEMFIGTEPTPGLSYSPL